MKMLSQQSSAPSAPHVLPSEAQLGRLFVVVVVPPAPPLPVDAIPPLPPCELPPLPVWTPPAPEAPEAPPADVPPLDGNGLPSSMPRISLQPAAVTAARIV